MSPATNEGQASAATRRAANQKAISTSGVRGTQRDIERGYLKDVRTRDESRIFVDWKNDQTR